MNKYLLAGLCLLAFVAGGAAQLALHRSGGGATPAATETLTAAPAQPENNPPAAPPAEPPAEQAASEAPAETAGVIDGQDAEAAEAAHPVGGSRRTVRDSRVAPALRGRAGLRAAPVLRRASAAPAPAPSVSRDEGVHEKAASGAKKTGRWMGKGLKKLGGVFHD